MANGNNNTDALVALADEMDRHVARLPAAAARMLDYYSNKLRTLAAIEALAAPAENIAEHCHQAGCQMLYGGCAGIPPAASVDVVTLRRWHAALDGYHPSDVPDTVAVREEMAALIEAVGGVKGERPSVDEDGDCTRCGLPVESEAITLEPHVCPPGFTTPQPAEGGQGELLGELRGKVALWRQRENSDEPETEFDKGYEQASDECADALERLIDSAGGAKGITGSVSPQMRDANACTPQPAEGDGAVLAEAARYHYAQADNPRDQFGNTSNHKNPKLEAWHRQIGDAITEAITRPAATAVVARPSDDELWDQTLRERDDAEKSLGDMFQAVTGRSAEWSSAWHYKDAIEEVEDHMAMLAAAPAAPAAPKGGDEATTAGMADEYRRWIDFYHAGEGDFADFMRREYPDQSEFATTPPEQGATGEQP